MILVVYLGHGIVLHPAAVLFFSKAVFGRDLMLSNCGISEKNNNGWCTSIVAPVNNGWYQPKPDEQAHGLGICTKIISLRKKEQLFDNFGSSRVKGKGAPSW